MAELTPAEKREQVIQASMARGRTREQAEAFLEILGSAFRRNGWAPGEPMTDSQIDKKLTVFLGTTDGEIGDARAEMTAGTKHEADEVAHFIRDYQHCKCGGWTEWWQRVEYRGPNLYIESGDRHRGRLNHHRGCIHREETP